MTKLIFAVYLLSLTLISCGQEKGDKDKERITAVCDKFMQAFRDQKISEAMLLLKQNSVLGDSQIDTLNATISEQMTSLIPRYGKIVSYEFILERKVKNFIAKRLYILKFEQFYLKVDLTLYNSGKGWKITGFNYNEDLIELLY